MTADADEFVPVPDVGRVFRATRRVRLGDVLPDGRMRLDALARCLQDVGNDDTIERGVGNGGAWVTRRVVLEINGRWPRYLDDLRLVTFPGGAGRLVVERRTDVDHEAGGIRTATVWAYLDPETMRPTPLPDWFHERYGEVTPDRRVSHRLRLSGPPVDPDRRDWPLRAADYDVLNHVNNAIAWAAVEDEIARVAPSAIPMRAALEYPGAIDVGAAVELRSVLEDDVLALWLVVDDTVRAAARVLLRL